MKEEEIKITRETKMAIAQAIIQALDKKEASKKKSKNSQWIEVAPHGLVGGMVPNVCLMVFRNKEGDKKFAIPLSQLQGEITVQQGTSKEEPFRFITELLDVLKTKVSKCYFIKYEKGYVKTKVDLHGHGPLPSMTMNANDIIPFAIYSGCEFYCTDKFIKEMQSQEMASPLKNGSMQKPDYLN